MVSTRVWALQLGWAACLGLVALSTPCAMAADVERRDGSTITASTTQFNPDITNQGGTTNAAGTFNVSPLATSTSYQFQTLSQTSTFQIGPVATQAPSNNGGSTSGDAGSNSTDSAGGINGNVGAGTVVVTATAPTSTVNMQTANSTSTSASASGSTAGIALGSNAVNAASSAGYGAHAIGSTLLATTAVLIATVFGATFAV